MLQIKNTLGGGKPEGMYVWKKLSAQGGDFIDYVVSDKETAYPNGGEKGGYWYERVSEGAKNIAFGKCTSGSTNYFRVEHGLGVKPTWFIIVCGVTGSIVNLAGYASGNTYVYVSSPNGGAESNTVSNTDRSSLYAFISDTVISVPKANSSNTWSTSHEYHWVCGYDE